jgi:UDP-glucose 4-epimerase
MILITGGAGYIGSHTCIELLEAGYPLLILDNLSNASQASIKRVEKISGQSIGFVEGDVRDKTVLVNVFSEYQIDAVIHFAGLKAVGESVEQPLHYYDNNVAGTLALLQVMAKFNCKKIVFSSSATVYGDPASVPIREDFPLSATNPYGRSKLMVEDVLRDLYVSDNSWSIGILRYFNPVGAHVSGLIGEGPNGIPNNLMPFVSQVAIGKRDKVSVFGDDYETHDGTGVRDYIHVVDLAKGHLKTLQALQKQPGLVTVNLGAGRGYSVLELIKAFEQASGRSIPYEMVARRPGDIAQCYADPTYAKERLDWHAELGIDRMCQDVWRWQSKNPKGYAK